MSVRHEDDLYLALLCGSPFNSEILCRTPPMGGKQPRNDNYMMQVYARFCSWRDICHKVSLSYHALTNEHVPDASACLNILENLLFGILDSHPTIRNIPGLVDA